MRILFFIALLLILIVFISGCVEKPVGNVNRPPVLEPIGDKTINEESTLTFTINASDPDNDSLAYFASNLPSSATFNTVTQTFSWTPTYAEGSYQVTFAVNDGSLSDNETITITVEMPEKKQEEELAAELGLPEGYNAEFLLKPDLLSPLFIAATSDDQLLVAEHYGDRLLRINPLTAEINVLYNLPHEQNVWNALLSDGADGAYMQIKCQIVHISGNGTYTVYYPHCMNPAALGPNGEIYGYTKSDVLVLQSKDEEPKTIATGFSFIFDLVRDKEGNLYVSDWDMGTITRVKPDGTKQLLISGLAATDPIDLGFTPDGTLYVNEDRGFHQIDTNSGALKNVDWFGGSEGVHPTDFAFLSSGKAYFVDPTHNNILGIDLQKEEIELVIRGTGNSRALDVGPDGAVYLGDNSGFPISHSKILRIQSNNSVEVYADNLHAITDLSFAQNGNMFVTTIYFGEKREYEISSVLLITPKREAKTLASWDSRNPGMRKLWSISVDPKTGLAIAYDEGNGELISIDENGSVSELPNSFNFDTLFVYLDHATDGTLHAIEDNKKAYDTGSIAMERNIIRFDEKGSPIIITDFNPAGNLAIAPFDGMIYIVGLEVISQHMALWRITRDGEKILLSDSLPIDPLSVAVDDKGNIYVASSAGLLKIWK